MNTVAYLANMFPSAVEPYVAEEIEELQRRGIRVIAGSVRRSQIGTSSVSNNAPEIVLQSAGLRVLARAVRLCLWKWKVIAPLLVRAGCEGRERPWRRLKALTHTFLGACYAVMLDGREVDHIHVHHGYFGSWIAMTAARLLNVGFSMTLHGSDLLLQKGAYLSLKLADCAFCFTVSEYNRNYILQQYPEIDRRKIVTARLGVAVSDNAPPPPVSSRRAGDALTLLSVGRLHAVKDHAFLVRACAEMRRRGVPFQCFIAGDGDERSRLEALIHHCEVQGQVTLLGHVSRQRLDSFYKRADIVVLTSRSEGIPLVLMEAMARGKIVLAPAITGIPELVIAGKTGFLYKPGSERDLVAHLLLINWLRLAQGHGSEQERPPYVDWAITKVGNIKTAAYMHVRQNFNRSKNLEIFGNEFLDRISTRTESAPDESLVLQQI